MIVLDQLTRKGILSKKGLLKINKEESEKTNLLLRKSIEDYRRGWRRAMEDYAKNPYILDKNGINC